MKFKKYQHKYFILKIIYTQIWLSSTNPGWITDAKYIGLQATL